MNRGVGPAAGIREGDVLAGKYRVERVLGAGGMGVVVAARHVLLDERVAIKFLLPEMLKNTEAVARFAREARAAVKIKSEHVARVFDVGTFETGGPYIVMEYLEGRDLAAWLRQQGPLPIEQAVEFVIQTCVAVAEAHSLGIVHRDLKPSNLFCVSGADGRLVIKVLDFGISKLTSFNIPGPGAATKTTDIMGSPLYMSPEQMQSTKDVDARTDIWALGMVLHELLTGRLPFTGATMAEIIVQVATRTPQPMRKFRPDIPDRLEAVFRKCTEKDRGRRYGDVSELAFALLPWGPQSAKAVVEKIARIRQSARLSATDLAPPATPITVHSESPTQTGLGSTARRRVEGRGRAAVALVGTSAMIVLAWGIWTFSRAPGPTARRVFDSSTATAAPAAGPSASVPRAPAVQPEPLLPVPTAFEADSKANGSRAGNASASTFFQKKGAALRGAASAAAPEPIQPPHPPPPAAARIPAISTAAEDPLQALKPHR